jgi:hypothetical protein
MATMSKKNKSVVSPFAELKQFEANDLYTMFDNLFTSALRAAPDAESFKELVYPNLDLAFKVRPDHIERYSDFLHAKLAMLELIKEHNTNAIAEGGSTDVSKRKKAKKGTSNK